jgi:hypothetical protein
VNDAYDYADALVTDLGLDPKSNETDLITLVAAADALDVRNYDSDSLVEAFEDALDKAESVLADASALQAEVDKALSNLTDAKAAMEATIKNWSYLNGIVAAADTAEQDIIGGKYLGVNVPDFYTALDEARILQTRPATKQHAIDVAAATLIKALGKLVTSDKADILAEVEDATALYDRGIAAMLTAGEMASFEEAYEAAAETLYNPRASQSQINDAIADLDAVKNALGLVPGVKNTLERIVDEGAELNASDYTDADLFATFKAALDEAQALLSDADALQIEVDRAVSKLQAARIAVNGRVKSPASLTSAIASYRAELASIKSKYVASDVMIFESMLVKAEQIAAASGSTQKEYDDALTNLKDLRAMLRLGANRTAIAATIAKADKVVTKYYTNATVSPFRMALNNAKIVNTNPNLGVTEQSIVDSANKQLVTTMGKLVYNVTKMKLAKKPKTLKRGKTFKLNVKVTPKAIQKQVKLTYKSSNKKVATVSKAGKIKAKKKGRATITITAPNGKKLKVKIRVK